MYWARYMTMFFVLLLSSLNDHRFYSKLLHLDKSVNGNLFIPETQ